MTAEGTRRRLLEVALGAEPADLPALGGHVVNVSLTFSATPALRLTTRGLLAVKTREHVPALL